MKHFSAIPIVTCAILMSVWSPSNAAQNVVESAPHSHSHDAKPREAQKKPSRADVLWQQAGDAFHHGDYETAILRYADLRKIEPDNVDAYSDAAWLIWSRGRGAEAAQLMRDGTKKNPRLAAMWYEAGAHFDLQKREPQTAYNFYERALTLKPAGHLRWQTLHRLAFASEKIGKLERAAEVWQRVLSEFPKDAVAIRKLRQVEARITAQNATSSTR